MPRDINKDKKYFDDYIVETESRSHKFYNTLQLLSPDETEKRLQCELYIANFERDILFAMYSRGDSKQSLKNQFRVYLKHLSQSRISSYYEIVVIISLAILFDITKSEIEFIFDESHYDDSLIKTLKVFIDTGKITVSDNVLFYEEYRSFYDYISDEINLADFQVFMNNEWYSTCKDLYWFDNLKSKQAIYTGYWCWLGAALLKMKKAKKIEIKYIPKDLIL